MKDYIRRYKASRTVRMALLKKIGGSVTIIIASLGYFENSVTPAVFGLITIVLGVIDYNIRITTTEKLD